MLIIYLIEKPFDVLLAGNEQEAVQLLIDAIYPVDLIISDIMMPIMNG